MNRPTAAARSITEVCDQIDKVRRERDGDARHSCWLLLQGLDDAKQYAQKVADADDQLDALLAELRTL